MMERYVRLFEQVDSLYACMLPLDHVTLCRDGWMGCCRRLEEKVRSLGMCFVLCIMRIYEESYRRDLVRHCDHEIDGENASDHENVRESGHESTLLVHVSILDPVRFLR